jgi:hypothetical protein
VELNPNHPVVIESREQWHKYCALIMHKLGKTELEIYPADVDGFTSSGKTNIILHAHKNSVTIKLVSDAEGEKLAREAGGLPI